MAKLLKLRRGTTAQHASFTGAEGEVTIDTTKDTAVIHDGSTAGGTPLAKQDMSNVPAGTILGTQLENSGVTGGQYGSSSAIPIITVDNQGLVTSASTTAVDSTKIQNGTTEVATANNGDITMKRSGTTRLVVDNAGVDVTGDVSVTSGKFYTDTSAYLGEVTSAGGSAESPDGSTELVNGTIGKDLSLRAYGDIVLGSSNSTSNTVAKFQMPVLGASKHGKAILNYVTANAGGNASSSTKLETSSSGISVTGNIAVSGTVDGVDIAGFKQEFDNAFPAGTRMLFQQTSAPTGWTKITSGVNNHALRVVSGTAGSGGNVAFSSAFATRGINATAGNTTAGGNVSSSAGNTTAGGNVGVSVGNSGVSGNVSIGNTAQGGNVSIGNTSTGGNVNNHTLSINQIPAHSHSMTFNRGSQRARNQRTAITGMGYGNARDGGVGNANTNNAGGNGGHSHGFSGSSHNHNASFSGSNHNHNASFSGASHSHNANASFSGTAHNHNVSSSFTGSAHNHSISVGNLDMNVEYIDVIIASKD